MKIFLSVIFVLLLSLITLHDANSADLLGYERSVAVGIHQPVVAVRTIPDGMIYAVANNNKTPSQLLNAGVIPTDDGKALDASELGTFFFKGGASKKAGPIVKKVPGPTDGW